MGLPGQSQVAEMAFAPPPQTHNTINISQTSFDVVAANTSLLSFKVTAVHSWFQGCFLPFCVAVNSKNPRILFFLLDFTALAWIVGVGRGGLEFCHGCPWVTGWYASANYQAALLKRSMMQANTFTKLISGCLWAKAVECAVLFVGIASHCLATCVV